MKTTLYDIAANIRDLINRSETGELTPEVLEQLEEFELSLEEKTDAYCVLIREETGREAALTAEIDRLNAARKTSQNAIGSLKDRLTLGFQLAGIKKLKTPRFTAWLQRGPGGVEVTALAEDLPTEFQRVKIEPDKVKLKTFLDDNPEASIEGVSRKIGTESIRIK